MSIPNLQLTVFTFLITSVHVALALGAEPPGHAETTGTLVNESGLQSAPIETSGDKPRAAEDAPSTGLDSEDREQDSLTDAQADPPRLLSEPFQHPHQLLQLLDIGPSDLNSFVDGQAISAADEEAFLKVLFRMPQIGLDDIDRWLQAPVPWSTLRQGTAAPRGEFFMLQGRVRRVTRLRVREKLASLFGFEDYFTVNMDVADDVRVTVYSRVVPQAWRGQDQLDQRCRVSGMFLKLGMPSDGQPHFLFATPRIAWLPDHVDTDLGIGPDQVLLGNLGMDVSLFDTVRSRNGLPIDAAERDCFYALLQAVGRIEADQLAQHATAVPVGTLLQEPERLHGRVLHVSGSVERITRVVVDEQDIQQRYGVGAYYQLDVLVSLDELEVRLDDEEAGEPGPVYRNSFPFTCCALSIPAAWQPYVGQEQADVEAVFHGFFYKIWSYSNPYVASFGQKQRQLSPMLIINAPRPAASAQITTNSPATIAVGIGFLIVLALIWLILWLLNRADRKQARRILSARFSSEEEPEHPDFQHLEGSEE